MPIEITMPALSPTMEEGTLARWLVKEGDKVEPGDIIAEIETDKATMEVEAVDEGTMGKILVDAGTENVPVNKPIGLLLGEEESEADLETYAPSEGGAPPAAEEAAEEAPEEAAEEAPKPESQSGSETAARSEAQEPAKRAATAPQSDVEEGGTAPAAPVSNGERVKASPLARRLAAERGIDLAAVDGSGPHGRIVKRDILEAKGAKKSPAAAEAEGEAKPVSRKAPGKPVDPRAFFEDGTYDVVPLDNMRRTVAARLTESKQTIPHYYLTVDCEIAELLKLRKELNARAPQEGEEGGYKLSVNDFLIRAAALAMKKVPDANVTWADTEILRHHHADIGVAVALDGGLITPIIRRAETKGLAEISNEIKHMAERARDRKLKPMEYTGGTFAVSNLGMYGIRDFTGVINPPHAAILAVGAGEERPVVRDGKLAVATMMTVTLSCDHRVIDGALGAQWLAAFKGYVEDPVTMLL